MLLNLGVARLAAVVYFVQGSLGIASIALPLYLRSQGFSIAKITFISSVAAIPWFFKIIYGAISDAIPIGKLRRKPYLMFYCFLSCLGWILLSISPASEYWLIASMMIANLGLAATDVITDGLVVEYSRPDSVKTYQGIAWGARSVGSVFSGFTGGILAATIPPQSIFLITSALPLVSLSATLLLREKPYRRLSRPENVFIPIVQSLRLMIKSDLRWFIVLLIIMSSSVAIGTPLFFYMREDLGFDEIFLGLLSSITWLGAVVGCFMFIRFFKKTALRKTLYWAIWIGCVEIMVTLLIRGHASAFILSFLVGILGYNVLLPIFSSAARLVHGTGVEGSLYAMLMSLFNLGQAFAGLWGGFFYERIGLAALIILTSFATLLAILVVPQFRKL